MRHPSEPGWFPEDPPALDGESAERLAAGRIAPEDAPPGYEGVASLLHSVASAAGPEPKGEAGTVAAMVAALAPATPTSLTSRRRQSMITKLVPAKVAAVAVGALLTTGTAAAAGALPDPVQSVVSDVFGTVGLDLPDGSGSAPDLLDVDDTTTTTIDDDTTTTTIDDDTTTTTIDDDTTTTTTTPGGGGDGSGTDACTSAANHGEFVSGVARATPRGPGHGAVVSDAAQSDCGKHGGDDVGDVDDETTDTTVESSSGRGSGNGNSGPANSGNGNSGKGNGGNGNSGNGGRNGRG